MGREEAAWKMAIEADISYRIGNLSISAAFRAKGNAMIAGPNGSGKTTLLRILAGHIDGFRGSIVLDGKDITNLPLQRRGVVYLNQDTYFPSMKVHDHIAWPHEVGDREEEIRQICSDLGIDYTGRVGNLSVGQRARVAVATAIFNRPRLILMDEVTSVISEGSAFLESSLDLAASRGSQVIYVTQNLGEAVHASEVYRMEHGSVVSLIQG